jgi:hypothetical protein
VHRTALANAPWLRAFRLPIERRVTVLAPHSTKQALILTPFQVLHIGSPSLLTCVQNPALQRNACTAQKGKKATYWSSLRPK